jgi:hypothetical protein
MQRQPNQLLCVELTTVDQTYPAPTNTKTTISAATVTNKSGTARYVTVTITPSGGTPQYVVYQKVIPAGATEVLFGLVGQTLKPLGALSALAEANSALDLIVSGYETSGS